MSLRGRKPKPDDQKVTRHALGHDWIEVDDVPYGGKRPPLSGDFPKETRAWWRDISTMPHCVLWTKSQWRFALDTARIHAAFVGGDMARAAELRTREAKLGTTLDAMRDLRIRYREPQGTRPVVEEEPESVSEPTVDFAAERKRRLTGAG